MFATADLHRIELTGSIIYCTIGYAHRARILRALRLRHPLSLGAGGAVGRPGAVGTGFTDGGYACGHASSQLCHVAWMRSGSLRGRGLPVVCPGTALWQCSFETAVPPIV